MTILISNETIQYEEREQYHESQHMGTFQGLTGIMSSTPWKMHSGSFITAGCSLWALQGYCSKEG